MSIFELFKKIENTTPKSGKIEKIIVGLGNPGEKYKNTRHNIGFVFIDCLASKYNISCKKLKFKALCGEGVINGTQVLLLKPQTYMNNSGESVREALQFYKLTWKDIIVVYDDISMEPGKLRFREQGSSGAHNGIKSLIYHLKSDVFDRIKIGVGDRPHREMDLADWVLSDIPKSDLPIMKAAVEGAIAKTAALAAGNREL